MKREFISALPSDPVNRRDACPPIRVEDRPT